MERKRDVEVNPVPLVEMLHQSDFNIKTISTLLGHASIKITMDTYVHLMSDTGKQAVEKLNAAI